jgi:hypothetical protein
MHPLLFATVSGVAASLASDAVRGLMRPKRPKTRGKAMGYEIIGAEDIVGGYEDEVGADGAVDAKRLPQSFVGMPPTDIPISSPGLAIDVPVLRNIRPDRLVFDRVQAASALLYDMKVGTVSLNASRNPIPGDAFAPDAVGTAIRAVEVATPSVGINLVIGNRTATLITKMVAGIFGPSMRAT